MNSKRNGLTLEEAIKQGCKTASDLAYYLKSLSKKKRFSKRIK